MISLRGIVCALVFSSGIAVFAVSPAIGENFKYESHGRRDPFVPLVGIERPTTTRLEDITSIGDVRLEGMASGPGGKLVAILNGEIVKEGDRFGEIEIGKINKKAVTLIMGGKNYIIDLAEEGGAKSGR